MVKVRLKRQEFDVALVKRNLSQRRLAIKLGMSRAYLSQIVTGKRQPSAFMRERLLDFFKGYSFDDLFAIEENGQHTQ
ncbi:helix-turn-helix transcriptional regulator [Dehalogenimonas sp. 4OHTPN]|uniref:Helix-turn-helix transcriptional regulator n=1 Tax=Dehalogenimonas sp. 4OHTPN TaxID=3166643 RepID=A0AAU8GD12_9CHLR